MTAALRAEDVLCGDESPVNVLRKDTDPGTGADKPGSPHVVTPRTPDARLIWFAPISARSRAELAGLGVLNGWAGTFVRDDYRGWQQFDDTLTAVQQCASHLLRHPQGIAALHPTWQQCAIRYADDFAILVHGSEDDTRMLQDEVTSMLAPLGVEDPDRAHEGRARLTGIPPPVETKTREHQVVRLHVHH